MSDNSNNNSDEHLKKIQSTWILGIKGLWVENPYTKSEEPDHTKELEKQIKKLNSIGYLAGYKKNNNVRSNQMG